MRFRVLAFLMLFTAAYGFSQSGDNEWYQGKPIREIVFTGLKNVAQSELTALMNPYRGRYFNYDIFWEIQGKLYALEYFDRIDPSLNPHASGSEVIINFAVTERPVISRINFVGNSGIRRTELLDTITTKVSDVFNQAKIRIDIEAIRNKYIEKGYPNVSVQAAETVTGDTIVLNFNITEGDKITIRRIEFQSTIADTPLRFSSNLLRRQLSLRAKSLLNDGAFQEAKLLVDIEAITKYYHDRGYIDAKIIDVVRTLEDDDKGVNMTIAFLIEEGDIFTFGGVEFAGNQIFSTEQLTKLINSRKGDTVNYSRVEADLQRVSDLYYENGYIFNSISRIPDKNMQTHVLSYTIQIVERSRAYIENIIIRGNEKTNTEVILREIPLEPGDVFSRTKVMNAMRNLYNLQFFSLVIPEPTQGSAEHLMDLIFTVEEQPTTDIQFGVTFSGSADPETFPISGLLKWNDRNLAGTGNQLGAELSSSVIDTHSFSLNYLHRWMFGLPLSGGFDFSFNYQKRLATMDNQGPVFFGNEPYAFPDGFSSYEEYVAHNKLLPRDYLMDYEQFYLSLGFSTGYRWATFLGNLSLSGGMRVGFIRNEYDDELFRAFDPALRAGNKKWTLKTSLWLSLSLDQRDIFYDPSKGYYLYERMGFNGLLPDENEYYIRNDTKFEVFFTLFDLPVTDNWNFKGVFGFHSGLSFIFKQPGRNPDALLPVIEDGNKLAVDGMFIGRGWSSEYRNKGLLLWDNWVELRFPIVFGILAFDLFFDVAGVETTQGYYFGKDDDGNSNFTHENLRFSLGGGLRFTLPQFPFRLSIAKRFRIIDEQVEWQSGALFHDAERPTSGVDLVISFVLSY